MTTKITGKWECPQCGSEVGWEESEQMRLALLMRSQVKFTCEDCGEGLTADTSSAERGFVDINENWIYY